MASSYRRALVFAILAAGGISLAGGLPLTTIQRAAAETRDPWYRPFTPTSIWNMPIGSGARYVAANMPPTGIDFSQAFLIRTSGSDPARPLYSPSSWSSTPTPSI